MLACILPCRLFSVPRRAVLCSRMLSLLSLLLCVYVFSFYTKHMSFVPEWNWSRTRWGGMWTWGNDNKNHLVIVFHTTQRISIKCLFGEKEDRIWKKRALSWCKKNVKFVFLSWIFFVSISNTSCRRNLFRKHTNNIKSCMMDSNIETKIEFMFLCSLDIMIGFIHLSKKDTFSISKMDGCGNRFGAQLNMSEFLAFSKI